MFVLAGVTACIPAPSPPPGYRPPVIDSVSVPAPAQPGTNVSIVVQAHDDQVISGLRFSAMKAGDGRTFPGAIPCSSTMDQGADITLATFTVTCMVPTFANNGTWVVTVNIADSAGGAYFTGTNVKLPFTVVGGSTDTAPPHLVSFATNPTQLHTNSVFTLTARFSDPSGFALTGSPSIELTKVGSPYSYMQCGGPQFAVVSPTLTDVTWSCAAIPGTTETGIFHGYISTIDGLGHTGTSEMTNITVS